MALVNLSVPQNKTNMNMRDRQTDRQTDRQIGTDMQGNLWGRGDIHNSSKELGALEVVNIHGIHVI